MNGRPPFADQSKDQSLNERFKFEYSAAERSCPRIFVSMEYSEAWALMQAVQLACKYPDNVGPNRYIAEKIARLIQQVICPGAALWQVAEDGWKVDVQVPSLHLEKNLN